MGEETFLKYGSVEAGGVRWGFEYLRNGSGGERLCLEGSYSAVGGDCVAPWDVICREDGKVRIKNLDGCEDRAAFDLFDSMDYGDKQKVLEKMCDGAEGLLREVIRNFDVIQEAV